MGGRGVPVAVWSVAVVMAAACSGGGQQGAPAQLQETPTDVAEAPTPAPSDSESPVASPAPSAVPTAEATEEGAAIEKGAPGVVLIEDTFDNDENAWNPADERQFQAEIGKGTLSYTVPKPFPKGFYYVAWPTSTEPQAKKLTDVRIDTTVTTTGPGVVGIVCRLADPEGGDLSEYEFKWGNAGLALITKASPKGKVSLVASNPPLKELQKLKPGQAVQNPPYDTTGTYEASATCVGGKNGSPVELALSINGKKVVAGTDRRKPIESGIAGVYLGQSTLLKFKPFTVDYDSWTLTDLAE